MRRGAERDPDSGKVVAGNIPRGGTQSVTTIKEGPLRRLADRLVR